VALGALDRTFRHQGPGAGHRSWSARVPGAVPIYRGRPLQHRKAWAVGQSGRSCAGQRSSNRAFHNKEKRGEKKGKKKVDKKGSCKGPKSYRCIGRRAVEPASRPPQKNALRTKTKGASSKASPSASGKGGKKEVSACADRKRPEGFSGAQILWCSLRRRVRTNGLHGSSA